VKEKASGSFLKKRTKKLLLLGTRAFAPLEQKFFAEIFYKKATACFLPLFVCGFAHAATFADPIDTPAITYSSPAAEPLIALTRAGDHLVAVGVRGVAMVSDASAQGWTQSSVPVESDLVAVQFPDAQNGWAVGHDGVILHSNDGGRSWKKQLDGIGAQTIFEADYNKQITAGNAALAPYLQQIQLNFDAGPTLPWLSVWFNDPQNGYVVGSFGDLAVTHDGGRSWQPWLEHIDDLNFYDLDAIKNIGGQLYITGEQGSVWWFDPAAQKFVARPTNYDGSLFGVTGTASTVIVFGMRGNIFRSEDEGKTWTQSADPSGSSIMSGTVLPDGRIALVNVDGGILLSTDDGRSFHLAPTTQNAPLTDIAELNAGNLVLTGLSGIQHATP
jgi:photosystem II stability/assembly factor-like uncharacterized protein